MRIAQALLDGVITFAIVFVVSAVVSYIYSLIAHGDGWFDWATAIRLGIILGVTLSYLQARQRRAKQDKEN